MNEMQDKFYAGVERASKTVAKHLEVIDEIKRQADKDLELWATRIVEVVPDLLEEHTDRGAQSVWSRPGPMPRRYAIMTLRVSSCMPLLSP